jgi:hypothetical protein
MNANRKLASNLQAPLGQNAVTLLKTMLRMEYLLVSGFFEDCELDLFLLTR